ncbi:MAG: hypothetical protein IJQ34_01025 [Kiritimatiellae bacterium]|nr:hypothetical protein [Kiritimatiellia bacterium]
MKLKLNKEFFLRHLFVACLMAGMSIWFGYDGFIGYPKTPASELYRAIEGTQAPEGCNLEAFKAQKIKTQYGFTLLTFIAALLVGAHLVKVASLDVRFDEKGFSWKGRDFKYSDILKIDDSRWNTKGICVISLDSGKLTLDAWHHIGVKEFHEKLKSPLCVQSENMI